MRAGRAGGTDRARRRDRRHRGHRQAAGSVSDRPPADGPRLAPRDAWTRAGLRRCRAVAVEPALLARVRRRASSRRPGPCFSAAAPCAPRLDDLAARPEPRGSLRIMDRSTIPESHRGLLDGPVLVLATLESDGTPQLSTVWFLAEDDTVLISLNTSRHKTANLRRNPSCSVLIPDPEIPTDTWRSGAAPISGPMTTTPWPTGSAPSTGRPAGDGHPGKRGLQ